MAWIWFAMGFILVFLLYNMIPNYYMRNMTDEIPHVLAQSKIKRISLTFDDGPDEVYTPQILDILKEEAVKATFFIVATKVEKQQHIIERMVAEGHQLAMHTYCHKSAWLTGPFSTIKEFEKSMAIFKKHGLDIKYFRPPWGTFNLLTAYGARKMNLKVVLWSVEAFDWRKMTTSRDIKSGIMNRIKDRDIIVLHDSGGAKGAPKNTVTALKELLCELKLEYQFVKIEEGISC